MVMLNEPDNNPSYAPIENVLKVIKRYRERGLPDPLTIQGLEILGISRAMAGRTIKALRFLALIDDEGRRTEAFENLRRASSNEYPGVLADILRQAYHQVFRVVDPAEDRIAQVDDAFRHFEPQAQRRRMVTLFLGLCREAGIVEAAQRQRTAKPQPNRNGVRSMKKPSEEAVKPVVAASQVQRDEPLGPDLRLVNALIQQLPKDARWTRKRKELWVQTFCNALDLVIEVTNEAE